MILQVSNLLDSTSETELITLFEEYGEIRGCELLYDEFTGSLLGMAHIDFVNKDEAQRAIDALNATQFQGKKIWVQEKNDPRSKKRKDAIYNEIDNALDYKISKNKKQYLRDKNSKYS